MRTKVPTALAILALVFATTLVVAAIPSGEASAQGSAICEWRFEEWYKITCGVPCYLPAGTNILHQEWIEREWCYFTPVGPNGPEWFPTHNLRWQYRFFCAYCQQQWW